MSRSAELAGQKPIAVAVGVLRDARGRVLVNQRPAGKPLAGFWEFPGGKIEPGESAWQALVREFKEELGLSLVAGEHRMNLSHSYPERSVVLSIWDVACGPGCPRSMERQALRWCFSFELRALDLLPANGPIVDSLESAAM